MSDKPQTKPKYEVGDWVRFYSAGKLVIGLVEYISPPSLIAHDDTLMTSAGSVNSENVLERRPA